MKQLFIILALMFVSVSAFAETADYIDDPTNQHIGTQTLRFLRNNNGNKSTQNIAVNTKKKEN